jgi:hypothetical protein
LTNVSPNKKKKTNNNNKVKSKSSRVIAFLKNYFLPASYLNTGHACFPYCNYPKFIAF